MEVDFVGHPLLDVIENMDPDPDFRSRHQLSETYYRFTLGSRNRKSPKC
ncbi:MAG: hypothetical protein R2769_09335 [Saprospiraceae bacterium]